MHSTMRFTDADRDERGFIRVRPLAELLPDSPPSDPSTPSPPEPPATPAAAPDAPRRRWPRLPGTRQQQQWALGGAIGLALAVGLIVAIGVATPVAPPRPVPSPTAAPATPPPSPVPPTPPPAIASYWAPGGDRAPDIAAGTVFTPTARYGDTWVSVELPGGGNVWIGRGDAGQRGPLPDALPDLAAPSPAPPPPQSPPIPAAAPPAPVSIPSGCALPDRPSHTSTRQVLKGSVPIGQVTGVGCSQAEADANAEQLAAAMRGGH